MRELICEKCRTKFICNRTDKECWCLKLPYVRLDETTQYNDCLCEKCLIELHDARSKNNNQG